MRIKLYILINITIMLTFITCNRDQEKRKIKLSEQTSITQRNEQFTSTIHLEPTLRRAIAIMFFENKTGDQNLEWLQKGLTEMLIRSLSQSSSLSVLSTDRMFEILNQLGESSEALDFDMAAIVAKEANVEAILTGNISRDGDSLQINVKVHEPNQGKILKEETVEGKGLEAIFGMVDDLSQKIKNALALSLEKQEHAKGIEDLSTSSLEAWRYYTTGVELFNKVMLNDAIKQFENAVAADSAFVSAYYKLCMLLFAQGNREKGFEYFQKLYALRPKATPGEQYQIDRLEGHVTGDLKKIIEASRRWVEHNPGDVDANFNLADIYFALGNYDKSLHYFKTILSIDPNCKPAYNMIGYCYARKGQLSDAIATLSQYKEMAPDEPNPFDSMGEIYYNYGDYKLADKNLKQSIERDKNFVASWLRLSDVYLEQGHHEKALEIINQFFEKATDPRSKADGYAQMGFIQWNLGNIDKAIEYFQKFVENRVYSYRAATWVNELYLEKNDSVNARKSLIKNYDFLRDSVFTREPFYIRGLANLSLWYNVNADESIQLIERALEDSNSPGVQMWGHFYLALLYLKADRLDGYKKVSKNFTAKFEELLKDLRQVPLARETWKAFLIFNQYAYQFCEEGIEKYNELINYCMENELTIPEMIFRLFLADIYFKNDERDKAAEQLNIIGAPEERKWLVIAPFDNTNGFQKKYPPERKIKPNKTYRDRNLVLNWQHPDDGFNEGYINFKQIYKKYNWSVAYGVIYVKSSARREAQIQIGTNDSVKLWVNDKEVWRMNIGRDAIFDSDIAPVVLEPGLNKILIKVCNRINEWGFYFRIADEKGKGIAGIEFVSADRID